MLCFASLGHASANDSRPNDIPENFQPNMDSWDFVRREAMVPMRDGVKLFTVILSPRTVGELRPIMLTRTPYSATSRARRITSPHLSSTLPMADQTFVSSGYIRVFQDVRGKEKSEGAFITTRPVRGPLNSTTTDEATDAWDTIDWLVKNTPNNNGRVGIIGPSYEGYLALMALLNPHPALKAVVPINPMVDGWIGDDWFHNGAFRELNLDWIYAETATATSDLYPAHGYRDEYSFFLSSVGGVGEIGKRVGADQLPFWNTLTQHPSYDRFWQLQAVDTLLRKQTSSVPTLLVHSLFDQEDIYGALAAYQAMKASGVGNNLFLVLGPWSHAQMVTTGGSSLGAVDWDADTTKYFRDHVMQPFLDHVLIGPTHGSEPPPVLAFDTGLHEWRPYSSWPPSGTEKSKLELKDIYLRANHKLTFAKGSEVTPSFEEYIADPQKPVPFRPRPILAMFGEGSTWSSWLVDDQRPFSDRTDVLTYTSDVLTASLTLAGTPTATLFASTTGTDADWVVKLIDVYPDEDAALTRLGGYQLMISGDILRARYREGFEHPAPVEANKVLAYQLRLPAVHHTFRAGHRLMIQIQSSWFPLYDRNPQKYVENIFWALPEDYRKATQRIYQSGSTASRIELPVMERRD